LFRKTWEKRPRSDRTGDPRGGVGDGWAIDGGYGRAALISRNPPV
jgi:hypothetical protein